MMARSLLTGWDEMTDKAMPDDSVRPADAGSDGNDGDDASRGGGARAAQAASPLITAIEIENFKGIGRPMRVDLRPVTLLFGNNSAGKSTVLHALCYAHEILSHGNVDVHETELGGRQIDLGGYRRFVHQHNPEREVRLRFELNLDGWQIPTPLRERLGSPIRARSVTPLGHVEEMRLVPSHDNTLPNVPAQVTLTAEQRDQILKVNPVRGLHGTFLQHDPSSDARHGWVELTARWDWPHGRPLVSSYEVGVNGLRIGRMQESTEGGVELLANLAHPWFEHEKHTHTVGTPQESDQANEGSSSTADGAQPRRFAVRSLTAPLPDWKELLYLETDTLNEPVELLEQLDERASIALVGLGISLRNALADLRYIGPLRDLRPRDCTARGRSNSERWADGSAAWGLLKDDAARHDSTLIQDSGDWLSREDRLNTGYALQVRSTVELPGNDSLVARIRESKRRHEIPRSKASKETSIEPRGFAPEMSQSPGDVVRNADSKLVENLANAIAGADVRKEVQLVSARAGLPVEPSDVGVGISQILPVVVAALDPDRPGITAIEQPELHLHPRIQVELGDLFAQQIDKGGIFLIETHSEHLLLRFMKRMRQTCDGTLPDGAPEVRPDNIAVYFVEIDPDGEQTLIREMPLNERGELVEAWPGGFFEEDLREIF